MGETMDPRRLKSDGFADREPCSIALAVLAYGGLAL